MSADDLTARLQRLEDLEEIRQLFVDYGIALDAGDFDRYASLFAEEGELLLGPVAKVKGRQAIADTMRKNLSAQVGESLHLITSPVITLDGDTATAVVMWTAIHRNEDDKPVISMIGKHHDKLVREHGRWRIAQRKGMIDMPTKFGR